MVELGVSFTLVGNGDIVDIKSAIKMFEYTKCDAISIGRGSLGNPWLFKAINHYLKTKEILEEPSYKERIEVCLNHAKNLIKLKGENIGIKEMRSLACFYIKGMPNASVVKVKINDTNTYKELEKVLYNYLGELI